MGDITDCIKYMTDQMRKEEVEAEKHFRSNGWPAMIGLSAWLDNHAVAAQQWHWPDGTKSDSKPVDAQVWSRFNLATGAEIEKWQWEESKGSWKRLTVVSAQNLYPNNTTIFTCPMDLDNYDFGMTLPGEPLIVPQRLFDGLGTKCECGSDKVGSPIHSSWCAKHS